MTKREELAALAACPFCGTYPNSQDSSCATPEQALASTAEHPYGCPWLSNDDKKRLRITQASASPPEREAFGWWHAHLSHAGMFSRSRLTQVDIDRGWTETPLYALSSRDDGEARPCTCHLSDNPPVPCAQKYAYSECVGASEAPSTIPAAVLAMKEAAYKAAWDAYVEASMCPEIKTFDCIKHAVDAAISRIDVPEKTAGEKGVAVMTEGGK